MTYANFLYGLVFVIELYHWNNLRNDYLAQFVIRGLFYIGKYKTLRVIIIHLFFRDADYTYAKFLFVSFFEDTCKYFEPENIFNKILLSSMPLLNDLNHFVKSLIKICLFGFEKKKRKVGRKGFRIFFMRTCNSLLIWEWTCPSKESETLFTHYICAGFR